MCGMNSIRKEMWNCFLNSVWHLSCCWQDIIEGGKPARFSLTPLQDSLWVLQVEMFHGELELETSTGCTQWASERAQKSCFQSISHRNISLAPRSSDLLILGDKWKIQGGEAMEEEFVSHWVKKMLRVEGDKIILNYLTPLFMWCL